MREAQRVSNACLDVRHVHCHGAFSSSCFGGGERNPDAFHERAVDGTMTIFLVVHHLLQQQIIITAIIISDGEQLAGDTDW